MLDLWRLDIVLWVWWSVCIVGDFESVSVLGLWLSLVLIGLEGWYVWL